MLLTRRQPREPLRARQVAAGAGIERTIRALWRIGRGGDVGAGAETGIDQAPRIEHVERAAVVREMFRLAAHWPVPVEAKPA